MRCKYKGTITNQQCKDCYNEGITKDKHFYKDILVNVQTRAHCKQNMEKKTITWKEVKAKGLLDIKEL